MFAVAHETGVEDHRLSPLTGDVEVEQDRAPHVQDHLYELPRTSHGLVLRHRPRSAHCLEYRLRFSNLTPPLGSPSMNVPVVCSVSGAAGDGSVQITLL
jgi:hypothetical protein